ncbi:hypothetical protein [Chelativorans sp. AA-79]|uniref:hypothetical protein n=1 Tax=Chelativorans sp. AA-79 TaxID=3028735 RepID=UPI0023F75EBB|nr:hypothetical protein [Chelativorans sp. AA-79]WEX07314.1 hypothetical protein PVE73_14365 [Chelativorans sp. AA-79]
MQRRMPALLLFLLAPCMPAGSQETQPWIDICSGYGCNYRTRLMIDAGTVRDLAGIMPKGATSARAERAAIAKAVQYFERRSTQAIGVADAPKGTFAGGRVKGQMDCIDESTNTRSLLMLLADSGLLRHHRVEPNTSRGVFLDGRYPHFTAVIRDGGGMRWAIDSWYEPAGGPPDIMPLAEWRKRGVGGER